MLGEIRYKDNKKMSDLSRKMLVFNKIELLFRHNNGCQQEILQLNSIEGCSLIRSFLWCATQNCIGSIGNAFIGHSLICTFCSYAAKSTNRYDMSKLSRRHRKGLSIVLKNKIKFSEAAYLRI